MKIDTAGRIIGSFLVVTAYFIILHVNLSLGVIMQFVGDAISVPFFIQNKIVGRGNHAHILVNYFIH